MVKGGMSISGLAVVAFKIKYSTNSQHKGTHDSVLMGVVTYG